MTTSAPGSTFCATGYDARFLDDWNGIESYFQYSYRIPASGTVHLHINNVLMGFGFSAVVSIAELEGFEAVFAAIKLCT